MSLSDWCDRVVRGSFVVLFTIVPLLLTPWNYELFEYNKMMAVYGLTVVIMTAWAAKMLVNRKIEITRTPFDLPILLYVASQFVSAFFSIDPHVSWFGYYSRFNGGMWSVISYVLLYYAFVSNGDSASDLEKGGSRNKFGMTTILKLSLGSATLVALYGVLERLGIDKHLWVQDVQNRVFSTLGQPNWLAAYLVALLPVAWAMFLSFIRPGLFTRSDLAKQGRTLQAVFWLAVSLLFFLVILFTRSRSGLAGLAVADLVFWGLLIAVLRSDLARQGPTFRTCLLTHLAFGLIIFFNGSNIDQIDRYFTFNSLKQRFITSQSAIKPQTANPEPKTNQGTLLEYGGTESGTIRKYVWQGAIAAWQSSPKTYLIGTGTETFAFAFYQHRPTGHNMTSEWDFLYNKAHNEYLNYLATTGVFGLGSYLLFLGAVIIWFIRWQSGNKQNIEAKLVTISIFAGWVSTLVTNFFGFSVVTQQLFLFLFPAIILLTSNHDLKASGLKLKFPSYIIWSLGIGAGGLAIFLLVTLANFWYADKLYASGYRLNRSGQFAAAQNYLSQAIVLNGFEPVYYDELSTTLGALAMAAAEARQATQASQLVQNSLKASDTSLVISPKNVNFWKSRTKIFYSFAAFDPQFNKAAVQAMTKALELSPNDPKILYNLAILYGREGDNKKAIELLLKAKSLRPVYRDIYFALSVFYTEEKNPELARQILKEYLTKVDANDKDFLERVK